MNNKKYRRILVVILLLISVYIKSLFTYSLAKYISDETMDYYIKSQGFYINSDKLAAITTTNINKQWDGSSVNFEVNNSLNDEVSTEFDISYTASCSVKGDAASYSKCTLNGKDTNTVNGILSNSSMCINSTGDEVDVTGYNRTKCEVEGYNWHVSKSFSNLYFDVVLTDNTKKLEDIEVNVLVKSTSPYEKSLSGNFILHKVDTNPDKVSLSYKSFNNYDKIIVSNSFNTDKCMKLEFNPSDAVLDVEDSEISSYATNEEGYINEIIFKIKGRNSIGYKVLKQKDNINENAFTISESSECE